MSSLIRSIESNRKTNFDTFEIVKVNWYTILSQGRLERGILSPTQGPGEEQIIHVMHKNLKTNWTRNELVFCGIRNKSITLYLNTMLFGITRFHYISYIHSFFVWKLHFFIFRSLASINCNRKWIMHFLNLKNLPFKIFRAKLRWNMNLEFRLIPQYYA